MSKIIIIEDDAYLREELADIFLKCGYEVASVSSFTAPEQEILSSEPDLAVLDLNLPGRSGFELCRWLKARASFPILILTAQDTVTDEVYALGLGADDYLTKPCHPKRLLARIERLLQTYGKMRNLIQKGSLLLDIDTYHVMYQESHIDLSEKEGGILRILMDQYPALVSKADLFGVLWGGDAYVDENILSVNFTRLRKSLDAIGLRDIIQTVRGQGYCLKISEGEDSECI